MEGLKKTKDDLILANKKQESTTMDLKKKLEEAKVGLAGKKEAERQNNVAKSKVQDRHAAGRELCCMFLPAKHWCANRIWKYLFRTHPFLRRLEELHPTD